MVIILSPIQELEPGATPYRDGRCAVAIFTDCQQQKNTLIMIMQVPAGGVESPLMDHAGRGRRRGGVIVVHSILRFRIVEYTSS